MSGIGTILVMGAACAVTAWSAMKANAGVPRPEHPRPDLRRDAWVNLNGPWAFVFDPDEIGLDQDWYKPGCPAFTDQITVPFPWESPLSGVNRPDYMGVAWYRREITIPPNWSGSRVFAVFGAVDWESTVWLDGKQVAYNVGGYTPFEAELTSHIEAGTTHTLTVRVVDRTEHTQPVGKQVNWYTRTSGIWQTAYLEARGAAYIHNAHIATTLPKELGQGCAQVRFQFKLTGAQTGDVLLLEPATDPEACADACSGPSIDGAERFVLNDGGALDASISIAEPQLWGPESPSLYFVRVRLLRDGETLDSVTTYFGIREVSAAPLRDGETYEYIFLNRKPIYLRGALDQSFHPAGVYSWPNDEAIRYDLEQTKTFGMNYLRLHIKIEEPRFLYWADRLGVLLQCDLPSFWKWSEASKRNLEWLYDATIERDMSHPSIFSWVLTNETWGLEKHDTPEGQEWLRDFYHRAKKVDPTRLIEDNSPCRYDHVETDINSWHFYIFDPARAKKHIAEVVEKTFAGSEFNYIGGNKQGTEPMLNSEYGGISAGSGDRDISWCLHYLTQYQRRHETICGYLYTELQDIEWEHNGLMNYDRSSKIFGYDEFVPLPDEQAPFAVADILGVNFLGAEIDPLQACEPGSTLEIPVWLSRFDADPAESFAETDVRVYGRFEGKTVRGECVAIDLKSIRGETPYPGVHDLGSLRLTLPNEPVAGVIGLWCEGSRGETIARGFATLHSFGEQAPREETLCAKSYVRRWRPSDRLDAAASSPELENTLAGWKISKPGATTLIYDLPVARKVLEAGIESIRFEAEMATRAGRAKVDWPQGSKPGDYPQTEADSGWPGSVTVRLNGVTVDSVVLPDDPADVRGFLSNLTNEHPSSYGYLTRIEVPEAQLAAVVAGIESSGSVRLELSVPSGTPLTSGLSLYGERAGRYPVDPCIVFRTAEEMP